MRRAAWRDAVKRSGLPTAPRIVALAMADWWPKDTEARPVVLWVSEPKLVEETGLSLSTVKRSLRRLIGDGWLVVVEKARQHRATRYSPAIPEQGHGDTSDAAQTVHRDTSGGSQGGHGDSARGVMVTPESSQRRSSPPALTYLPHQGARPEPAGDDLHPGHPSEPNAVRALGTLARDLGLPLTAHELLAAAYRHGAGDPWAGYLIVKQKIEEPLTGVRDVGRVLRSRLRSVS